MSARGYNNHPDPAFTEDPTTNELPSTKEKDLPLNDGPILDGHVELHDGGGTGGAMAILKGDVVRKLTTFERKAALINA